MTDPVHEDQEKKLKAGRDRAITQRGEFCGKQQYMGSPTGISGSSDAILVSRAPVLRAMKI